MTAGMQRRRDQFFSGSHADPGNEMSMQNALLILRSEIEKLASASGLPQVSEGEMSRMLSAGQQHLLAQGPSALLNFRPGSSLVTQLAQQAFNGTFGAQSPAALQALRQQQAQAGDGVGVAPGERIASLNRMGPMADRNGNSNLSRTTGYGSELAGYSANASGMLGTYTKAFAGTGLDTATVKTFAEVGMNRRLYDRLRREGYGKEDIKDSAEAAKSLEWKGEERNESLVYSGKEFRDLTVETDKLLDAGHTEEGRAKFEEMKRKAAQEPDAKKKAAQEKVIDWVQQEHKELVVKKGIEALRSGNEIDRAQAVGQLRTNEAPRAADAAKTSQSAQNDIAAAASTLDSFGMGDKPSKAADAKPSTEEKGKTSQVAEVKPPTAKPAIAASKLSA